MYQLVIEYHKPEPDEWQMNDVILDAYMTFRYKCYKASPLAILELYLKMGMQNEIPFHTFIFKLVCDKKRDGSCQFTLVQDIGLDDTNDEELKNEICNQLKDSKFEVEFPLIISSLVSLNFANPPSFELNLVKPNI